jgi:diguanylate cyclase (GGDEF)-like protein
MATEFKKYPPDSRDGKKEEERDRVPVRELGGNISMIDFLVKDLMVRNPIVCDLDTKVIDALNLMQEYDVGSVIVLNKGSRKPINIITHKDIISALYHSFLDRKVSELIELLEKDFLITIHENAPVVEALRIFDERGIEHLPVVDDEGLLVGILTGTDIMKNVPQFLFIDPLTGLENRRYLEFLESRLLRQCKYDFYVLVIDLDNFKEINDNYGHLFGDRVLKEVAKRILSSVRSYDNVIRFGGEEFVALIYRVNRKQAELIAERIRPSIESIIFEEHPEVRITASIGVSPCKGSLLKSIEAADRAMYEAKKKGKNRVEFAK